MLQPFTVLTLEADRATRQVSRLAEILTDSIEGGAVVGHILPVKAQAIDAFWLDVIASVARGERVLICAMVGDVLAGTVQLYLSPEPNAPHRAEVYKLLVHRAFRGRGMGEALMRAVEHEALRHRRNLLLLDTVQDGAAERLYRRLGWTEIGVVPRHFVDPWGNFKSSVYMMRVLEQPHP